LKEELVKLDAELLFADGFDDCIAGLTIGKEGLPVVIYSRDAVIDKLAEEMSEDEAWEYFDFNIACAYVGPRTPQFLIINSEHDT
jgi:hypothetical protein